jgi:hypothetical protein
MISYVRLTIGRIDPEDQEVEFVDTLMSPERSIFSSKKLIPGEYVILVEVYWEQEKHTEITLGTYSQGPVILEKLKTNTNLYTMSEYMIWKSFANQKRGELTKMNPNYIYDKGINVSVEANKYKNQNYAMVLYDYRNTSNEMTAHQVVGIAKSTGFNIVSAVKNGNNCDLIMNPEENDVILFKMDPRSQGFSLSHRVVQEELLKKNFSKPYQTVFEMLNELGSIDANPNNTPKMDPKKLDGLTKHLKDKMLQEQKMKSKEEKIRKMKEEEKKRKEKIENQRQKQYHKSKLNKYDPMNLIFGFQGGQKGLMSLLEHQGFKKGWEQWNQKKKNKPKRRGMKGLFSNFSELQGFGQLNSLLEGFGGFSLGGEGMGFGNPSRGNSRGRSKGRGKGKGRGRGKHKKNRSYGGGHSRNQSSGHYLERGKSPLYQNKVVYQYTDSQGNSGGYSYNLSGYSGKKSKLNKDMSGKKSNKYFSLNENKQEINDPLTGKNSLFNKADNLSQKSNDNRLFCSCISN